MKVNLSFQNKLKLLPWLLIAGLVVVYIAAVSETVKLRNSCTELRKQVGASNDAPTQLQSLTARLKEISSRTGEAHNDDVGDPLLNFFSIHKFSNACLTGFLPLHTLAKSPYLIETRIVTFEGTYRGLLMTLFTLERDFKSGKVVSVKFESEVNLKTEQRRLLMTLYIQSISNDDRSISASES